MPGKLLFLLIFFSTTLELHAQDLVWAKSMGGVDPDYAYSVAVGTNGSVYSTGTFYGSVDFDPSLGVFILSNGGMFIQKLNASGDLMWARRFSAEAFAIATDAQQNVYVTGSFAGTVDFDPGSATYNLSSLNAGIDVFVLKLDSSANLIWAKCISGTHSFQYLDIGCDILPDNNGNVYIAGGFKDSVDFDPGPGVHTEVSGPSMSSFLLKLDTAGTFGWVRQFPTYNSGYVRVRLALDNTGAVYVSKADTNTYKIDGQGNIVWAKKLSSAVYDIAKGTDGSTYVTGTFIGAFDFDPSASVYNLIATGGNTDIFIVKLDAQDNFEWAKQIGGAGHDQGMNVDIDANNNVYVTGQFSNAVDFDPGVGTNTLTSSGSNDIFVLKLYSDGGFISARQIGGTNSDYVNDATLTNVGELLIAGNFADSCDVDPDIQVSNLVSNGSDDALVLKFSSTLDVSVLHGTQNNILIYPNPTNGTISISSDQPIKNILIRDILGRTIQQHNSLNAKEIVLEIEMAGIYLITITDDKGNKQTQRLVVNR